RTGSEQQPDHRGMAPAHGPGQWRGAVEGVLDVHVGLAAQEQFDDLDVALVGGETQRGGPVRGASVHLDALAEQFLNRLGIPFSGGGPELVFGSSAAPEVASAMMSTNPGANRRNMRITPGRGYFKIGR